MDLPTLASVRTVEGLRFMCGPVRWSPGLGLGRLFLVLLATCALPSSGVRLVAHHVCTPAEDCLSPVVSGARAAPEHGDDSIMLMQSAVVVERATLSAGTSQELSASQGAAQLHEVASQLKLGHKRHVAAAMGPVAPWAAISLAMMGHGHTRDVALNPVAMALRDPNATLFASEATGVIARLVKAPIHVVQDGGGILLEKAGICVTALLQVVSGSFDEILSGNPAGMWNATLTALQEAQQANQHLNATMSADGAASLGILCVFAGVALVWGVELLYFSRFSEEKVHPEEDEIQSHAPFLYGLNFARFLMSWHVVLDNFYQRGDGHQTSGIDQPFVIFARWGVLAVPWFFVVSGFSHTYTKMVSSRAEVAEDWFGAMVKRVGAWYPLYLIVLVWLALHSWTGRAEDWAHFMGDVLLIHGLIWEDTGFPWLEGSWWLCFLMVYLLLWFPMYQVLNNSSNSVIWTLFNLAVAVMFPLAIFEWYFHMDVPIWVCLNFWPSFVFGQALAVWFIRHCMQETRMRLEGGYMMRPAHDVPLLARCGATLSILILGIFWFCFSPYDNVPVLHRPLAPLLLKGGLLPLFAVMVIGLGAGVDPVAKLFARAPFKWAGKVAYTNFVLQVPVHNVVKDVTGWQGLTWTFSGSLLLASVVGHVLVERPWRRFWGTSEK